MARDIGNNNQAETVKASQWPVEFFEMVIEPGNENATIRYTNLFHKITVNGKTYSPVNAFLSISSIRDDLEARDDDITITLSGVTSGIIGLVLNHKIPGSTVKISRGFYNEDTGQLVEDPYQVWDGLASSWAIEDDETFSNQDAVVVTVQCRSTIESVLGRKNGMFTSPPSIQRYYNAELKPQTGFEVRFSGADDGDGTCSGGTSDGTEEDSTACKALGGTWTVTDSNQYFKLAFNVAEDILMEGQSGTEVEFIRGEGTGTAGWDSDETGTSFYCNPGQLTGAEIAAQVLSAFNGNKIHNSSSVRTDSNLYEANIKSGAQDTVQFYKKDKSLNTAPVTILVPLSNGWHGVSEDSALREVSVNDDYLERSFDFVAGLTDKDIEFGKPVD